MHPMVRGCCMPVMPLLSALTHRWSWRSRTVTAARLHQFALAEHNTFLELTEAAEHTPDPKRAAAYLRHAADEARHTRAFVARSRALGAPYTAIRADNTALFSTLGEPTFLAFVARGEARAVQQFTSYERVFSANGERKMAQLFGAILPDEAQHTQYATALLDEVNEQRDASPWRRRAALFEARLFLMTAFRTLGQVLFTLLFLLFSPLLFPFAWVARRTSASQEGR